MTGLIDWVVTARKAYLVLPVFRGAAAAAKRGRREDLSPAVAKILVRGLIG